MPGILSKSQLPEKPWKAGAIARLIGSVIVCFLIGADVASVFRYFQTPQTSSGALFLALAGGAFALFVTAIVMLVRRWQPEKHLFNLLAALTTLYGGFLCMWLAQRLIAGKTDLENPIVTMLIAVLAFQGAALVLVHFFLREHGTGWMEGFGLNKRPALALLAGAIVGPLTLFPAWWLQELSSRLFERLTLHPHEQEAVEILRNTEGWPQRLLLGLATILIAPIGEEIIFRGILYPAIKRTGHQQLALWSTAILFGAIHVNLGSFIPLTLLAVVLVLLYEHTGNLLACITVHCFFNAANFVALYYFQK